MKRVAFLIALIGLVAGRGAAANEPLQVRLLRTVQLGTPQDVNINEITRLVDKGAADYETTLLARSALLVLHVENPRWTSFDELLDSTLNNLFRAGNSFPPNPDLPNFGGKETVLTMVYAMVMSGNQERAIDDLDKHLHTGSRYKQAIVLQALRNIGTQRAKGMIQQYADHDDHNIAENTLADEDYPVFSELYERWNMVPPAQRTREQLLAIIKSGCDQRTAMASYWLGFFPPHPDPRREKAELDALRTIIHTDTPTCEMMEHVIALKSLGLRSPESIDFWVRLLRKDGNVWERHQVALIGFARYGRQFAPAALDLLKSEPAQYVQWELMDGNLQAREGRKFRSYWDIWIPVTLQFYLNYPEGVEPARLEKEDLNGLLSWLESGARPIDPWVGNHLMYALAGFVSGDDTRRCLRLFNSWPQRNQNWWILTNLQDVEALPVLRYWNTQPAPQQQAANLQTLINNLERITRSGRGPGKSCCAATRECLLQHLSRSSSDAAEIRSEQDVQAWLAGKNPGPGVSITFADELQRVATVHRAGAGDEHWEYLYDCWRRTDPTPAQ